MAKLLLDRKILTCSVPSVKLK